MKKVIIGIIVGLSMLLGIISTVDAQEGIIENKDSLEIQQVMGKEVKASGVSLQDIKSGRTTQAERLTIGKKMLVGFGVIFVLLGLITVKLEHPQPPVWGSSVMAIGVIMLMFGWLM